MSPCAAGMRDFCSMPVFRQALIPMRREVAGVKYHDWNCRSGHARVLDIHGQDGTVTCFFRKRPFEKDEN